MTDFIDKKYRLAKVFLRYRLAIEQFIQYPWLNLIWLAILIAIIYLNKGIDIYIASVHIPKILESIFCLCMEIFRYIFPTILILLVLQAVGDMASRKDEAIIEIIFTESSRHTRTPSILYSKKKIKGCDIIERKFYTYIAMAKWKDKKEEIQDLINCNIVGDIYYVNSNGNKIGFQSLNGREGKKRGVIYDEF